MINDTKIYILTDNDYKILNEMCKCCLDLKKCNKPFCKKKKIALWLMKCSKEFKKQGFKHIKFDETRFFKNESGDLH